MRPESTTWPASRWASSSARRLIDGRGVRPGDAVIGLLSSGLHSNGYSLARKVVFERARLRVGDRIPGLNRTVGRELLRPTRIYVKPILALLRAGAPIRAMAHITGGGLTGNVPRVLPPGCRAVIRRDTWPVSEVFRWLQDRGRIDEAEMFQVFNMGIGFVLVVPEAKAASVLARLWKDRAPAFRIGEIRSGARGVTYR